MMLAPAVAVMQGAEGPVVNLYSEGEWELGTGSLAMRTDYPRSGAVEIEMRPKQPEALTLRLRIPAWSEETTLAVNGAPVADVRAGGWAVLARTWKPGDRVSLQLDFRGRVLRASDGGRRYAAIMRGPVALVQDARLSGGGSLPSTADDHVALRDIATPPEVEMAFAAGDVALCDYASAGNTWDNRSRYRTWMPV
jgi:hypothetical protein